MKSHYLLTSIITILVSLISFSCEETSSEEEIRDTWRLHSITAEKPVDLNGDKIFNTDVLLEIKGCSDMTYVFNNNGKYNMIVVGATFTDKYAYTGEPDCDPQTFYGTWKVDETNKILHLQCEGGIGFEINGGKGPITPEEYKIDLTKDKLLIYKHVGISQEGGYIWATSEFRKQ